MATPYGIRAHLPCIDVGEGLILIDIFCHSTHSQALVDNRIYLLLQWNITQANEDPTIYSCYNCQWLDNSLTLFPTRIVHITESTTTPGNHSSPAEWRDIYISARPGHRAHIGSHISELVARLAMNAPKFPSFRIQPSMISNGLFYCGAVTHLPPSLPWTGDPPFSLVFGNKSLKTIGFKLVVTLGVCGRVNKDTARTSGSNPPIDASHYYAVLRTFYTSEEEDLLVKVSSGSYDAREHDCREDHVSHGSTITRTGFLLNATLKISFRKSLVDTPGETLEVHMGNPVSRQYHISQGEYDMGLTFR